MIIACFATMATRRHQLKRAVESILGQVDRVFIYLNGAGEPWEEMVRYEKITWEFSRRAGWKGGEAKFWWSDGSKFRQLELADVDAYFCCDDDILYPPDYVAKMLAAIERHPGDVVGVHGARVREPIAGYHECLDLRAGFANGLQRDTEMHILGTGTVAFRPRQWMAFPPALDFSKFPIPNMADLWLAICARDAGRRMWAIDRPPRWLVPIPTQGYSISASKSRGRDLAETELVQMYSPWPSLA